MRASLKKVVERERRVNRELHDAVYAARHNDATDASIIGALIAMLASASAELSEERFERHHSFNARYLAGLKNNL